MWKCISVVATKTFEIFLSVKAEMVSHVTLCLKINYMLL